MNKAAIRAALDEPAPRFALPMAYADPAFGKCLSECVNTPELVANFDRLRGTALRLGKMNDTDMQAFIEFVHDCVYSRLPDAAINAFRAAAVLDQQDA